jgi:hypothetical protein
LVADVLDRLKRGQVDAGLEAQLKAWRVAVMEKVASMQYESVEEIGRRLNLPKATVPPVPFFKWQQKSSYTDGGDEDHDLASVPPQKGAEALDVQGPRRRRPLVPLHEEAELDPHDYEDRKVGGRLIARNARYTKSLKGACLCLCPQWRRKPCYRTLPNGEAEIVLAESESVDALRWKTAFAKDARLNYIRSHVHKCKPTCWKHKAAGDASRFIKVCRFHYNHDFETIVVGHRKPPRKCDLDDACPLRKTGLHPHRCPVQPLKAPITKKFLRLGRRLCLPRMRTLCTDGSVRLCSLLDPPTDADCNMEDLRPASFFNFVSGFCVCVCVCVCVCCSERNGYVTSEYISISLFMCVYVCARVM